MERHNSKHYVMCVKNDGYAASLEVRKVYKAVQDPAAERNGLIRVIDESDEDYLYPAEFFVPIAVPKDAALVFSFPIRRVAAHRVHARANANRGQRKGTAATASNGRR